MSPTEFNRRTPLKACRRFGQDRTGRVASRSGEARSGRAESIAVPASNLLKLGTTKAYGWLVEFTSQRRVRNSRVALISFLISGGTANVIVWRMGSFIDRNQTKLAFQITLDFHNDILFRNNI